MVLTPTPQGNKVHVGERTERKRSQFMLHQLKISTGSTNSSVNQAARIIKSFPPQTRAEILKHGNIQAASIDAEALVALKADGRFPWEKMKTIGR